MSILADEVNVKEVVIDSKLKSEVELDINITPELREEGTMRDLVRMIQGLRHDAGYTPNHAIGVYLDVPVELIAVISKHLNQLKKDVKAKNIEFKRPTSFDAELKSKLENFDVWLAVKK